MIFETDYRLWNDENVFEWLINNVGESYVTTATTGIGQGWEVHVNPRPGTTITIAIDDRELATAFKLRFL